MKIANSIYMLALAMVAGSVVGCAHEGSHGVASEKPTTSTFAQVPAAPHRSAVAMSTDLRRVCGIEDKGEAPKFDFDSTVLTASDRNELDQLSKCMTSGPLAGKDVQLVGRADPRGEAEYNMNLGATRADAVRHYLSELGVGGGRLATTSRGALDAEGHDEAGWAMDRRVDLRLAGQ